MPTAYFAGVASEGDIRNQLTTRDIGFNFTAPVIRACENGRRAGIIQSMGVVMSGANAQRLGRLAMFNQSTGGSGGGGPALMGGDSYASGWFSLPIAGVGFDSGHTLTAAAGADGPYFYSRSSPGLAGRDGYVVEAGGPSLQGILAGAFTYQECPAAPTMLSVTPSDDGRSATIRFSGSGDTGGGAITGWRLARSRNAAFTSEVVIINSSGTSVVTGLTPGVTYYWKAIGRNWASDWAGALGGVWSAPMARLQPNVYGGKIRGTAGWENAKWKIHSGSGFVDAKVGIYDGTKFVTPKS